MTYKKKTGRVFSSLAKHNQAKGQAKRFAKGANRDAHSEACRKAYHERKARAAEAAAK